MPDDTSTDPIVCPISRWFYIRYGRLALMLLVFAAWFYKDGAWSWPKENAMAAERERYEAQVADAFAKAKADGTVAAWKDEAKTRGVVFNPAGEPISWAAYAAQKGWPEKPKKRTPTEIGEQFYWSGAMGIGVVAIGIFVLMKRSKKLIGYADHFVLPDGRRVAHADAFRIDARKWNDKGLAYVSYREGQNGAVQKAVIDCLAFQDADKVYDQLVKNFHGELIEKQVAPEEADDTSEDSPNVAS